MNQVVTLSLLLSSSLSPSVMMAMAETTSDPPPDKKLYTRKDLPKDKDWVQLEDGSHFMPASHDPKLINYMQKYARQQQKQRRANDGYNDAQDADAYEEAQDEYDAQDEYAAAEEEDAYDNAQEDEYDAAAQDADGYYTDGSYSYSTSTNSHYRDHFLDGSETFWPEGAQAWRLLGYYIDCYQVEQGYSERRDLGVERDLSGSGSQDEGCDSGACLRYLLWAAYVDVEYAGGGIGEYQYYNSYYKEWDQTPCEISGTERCAKMDCHSQDSDHFYLLGFFKEPNFAQFYEQLFKHQGVCLWEEEEYEFMQNMRENWPRCCTASGYEEQGNILYFDKKPLSNADVTLGLYTDERCSVDYTGKTTIETVVTYYESYVKAQQDDDDEQSGDRGHRQEVDVASLVTYISEWNSGMEIYKQCQPCKAYNMEYESPTDDAYWKEKYGNYWYYYKRNGEWNYDDDNQGEDDYSNDDSGGNFKCEDDAGYTNVNQCMKFATHTKMMAATFRDVMTAASQGTINDIYVGNIEVHPGAYRVPGTNWQPADLAKITFSGMFFMLSGAMLALSYVRMRRAQAHNEEYKANLLQD